MLIILLVQIFKDLNLEINQKQFFNEVPIFAYFFLCNKTVNTNLDD